MKLRATEKVMFYAHEDPSVDSILMVLPLDDGEAATIELSRQGVDALSSAAYQLLARVEQRSTARVMH